MLVLCTVNLVLKPNMPSPWILAGLGAEHLPTARARGWWQGPAWAKDFMYYFGRSCSTMHFLSGGMECFVRVFNFPFGRFYNEASTHHSHTWDCMHIAFARVRRCILQVKSYCVSFQMSLVSFQDLDTEYLLPEEGWGHMTRKRELFAGERWGRSALEPRILMDLVPGELSVWLQGLHLVFFLKKSGI